MFDFIAQAAEPVITGLDVVKTVEAFYYNAWLMLVGLLALFGSLVVVVMPLIMQRIQSSSFDKTEKRLKDEIEQSKIKTQESIQEEVKVIKSKFDEIQKDIEKQIDKRARSNRAEFYAQLATSFMYIGEGKFSSFLCYITAAREYATLKKYELLTNTLNQVISIGGIRLRPGTGTTKSKKEVKKTQTLTLEHVDKLRRILEEQGVEDRYSEQLAKVNEICNNLVTVADEQEPPEEPEQA